MSPSRAPAPTAPALVNVLERCGASVTRSGKVSESVDKHLGRKALVVDGDVPAAHFVRLPKVGKPGLRLAGAYAYLQVRLDPERFYAAHVDLVCVDRARPDRSDASVDYQVGRKVVRVSVSNLYRAKPAKETSSSSSSSSSFGAVSHHLQPPHRGWFCVRIDARASLRCLATERATEHASNASDAARLTFESIKSFQIGGAVAVRGVYVASEPFDEESAPSETRASTKPDAVVTWLDAGPVDEYPAFDEEGFAPRDDLAAGAAGARSLAASNASSGIRGMTKEKEKTETKEKAVPDADARVSRSGEVRSASGTSRRDSGKISRTFETTHEESRDGATRVDSRTTRSSYARASEPDSEPDSKTEAFLARSSVVSFPWSGVSANNTGNVAMEDVATLRTVIGASCETSASLSATRDGRFVAYAADKAVVVASLDDPDGSLVDCRRQILSGHAEAVTRVAFSECGTELVTAQKGPFPCVSVYRAVSTGVDETDENVTFVLRASFRASCASATELVTAQKKGGGTRLALLGETPAGSFQKASIEVWDWDYVTGTGTTPPAKILSCVLRETARATCVAFSPDRDDRLFVCGDGFVTEATLALDPASRSMRLIEKPVCFKDLDLDSLGGDASAVRRETRAFTTLAFLVEQSDATDANGSGAGTPNGSEPQKTKKTQTLLFAGTESGAVARMTILDDDSENNSGNAACAPECAFQLHAGAVASLAFFAPEPEPGTARASSARRIDGADVSVPIAKAFAVTASADGTVRVWPADFSTAHVLEAAHENARVVGAAFARRRRRPADTGAADTGALVVTATSEGAIGSLDLSKKTYAFLTTSPSPASASGARAVTSLSSATEAPATEASATEERVVCAACDDGAARGWDAVTGELVFACAPPGVLPGSGDGVGDGTDAATSVCFRPREERGRVMSSDEGADGSIHPEPDALAVGYASGAVRVFSISRPKRFSSLEDKGAGHPETRETSLVAEILDAHAPGTAVDAVAFAGRGGMDNQSGKRVKPYATLFSAARDGTLCAIESNENGEKGSPGKETQRNARETFVATRRVRVAAFGARAAATTSPCGGYVLVAASAGSLGAAATGGSRSSGHVLVFDADTLALKPPAMRSHRGGVASIAACRVPSVTDEHEPDGEGTCVEKDTFSVFVAGDDAAAVVSRHSFPYGDEETVAETADGADDTRVSARMDARMDSLSATALVRTAAEPSAFMRAAHAPTSLAETYDAQSRGGARVTAAVAATLGVAADKAGRVVATCGADGTVLVTPVEQLSRVHEHGEPLETRRAYEEAAVRSGRRFVGAHAGATRGVTFLQTYENAERRRDCLMATVGEGRVLCVWDVRAGALESVSRDERVGKLSDERDPRETFEPYGRSVGKLSDERDALETKQKAFGLAPSENSAPFDARASRGAPSSAGYARALPEPWAHRSHVESDRDGAKKNWRAFPSRTVGLAAGASAAAEERTENAAAVAAAAAAPGALYVPELGALAYAAGAEVVIERMGGDKTQAVLRGGHEGAITALARHADSRRVASASPAHALDADDATIRVWDSGTGAMLFTATHESCGGAVSVLAFSPSGTHLLSLGQDPEGAIRVFSLPSKRIDKHTRRSARGADADEDEDEIGVPPATLVSVVALAAGAPVASGAWLSPDAFFVVGADGATAYRFGGARRDDGPPGNDAEASPSRDGKEEKKKKTTKALCYAFPFRFEDERGDALDPAPVCTAATALACGGEKQKNKKHAEAFAGDSRGRVWACGDDALASVLDADEEPTNAPARRGFVFRMLRGALEGAPLAALPRGEAATTMSAFTDTGGRGVFVGSARRARVLFSEHPLPVAGGANDVDARYWYELGELALDGAVTSSRATTFVTGVDNRFGERAKLVTATTSAGTAWAVDTRSGVASALAHAHAVDVAGVTAFENALATVTRDGAARVWESVSFAKAVELFPANAEEPRCVTSALCGDRVCFAREDGTVRVVDFCGSSKTGNARRRESDGDSDVAASAPYVFTAHPNGGAVVAAAFSESLRDPRETLAWAPLVSVATDGSVAVTEFFPERREDLEELDLEELARLGNDLRLPKGGRVISRRTRTETTVVVRGGPGGVLPVRAAAVEDGVFPARVAAARDDAVRVFSLRRNVSSQTTLAEASGDARFVASLTFEHAPVRLESPVSGEPRFDPGRSACVAWSAANAGVLYYAGAATGGDLLVLDATRARGDGGAAAGARTSVVKLPLFEPGDSDESHESHDSRLNRTRCVAVASSRRSAGDLVAVGGDGGCVFFEIAARETAGFAAASSAASDDFPALDSGSGDRREMTPTRVSRFVSPNPVVSVDWAEPPNGNGGFSDDVRGEVRSATTAFLAAGAEVYAFDDEALFEAP